MGRGSPRATAHLARSRFALVRVAVAPAHPVLPSPTPFRCCGERRHTILHVAVQITFVRPASSHRPSACAVVGVSARDEAALPSIIWRISS